MDKLTAIFDGLDFSKLVPRMDGLLNTIQLLVSIAILVGPVVMVVMGVRYLFLFRRLDPRTALLPLFRIPAGPVSAG